jgi:orotidine-5'-phosphate decarboxylase
MDTKKRIFCAIDTPDLDRACALARAVGGGVGGVKLGLEFFSAQGASGVRAVMAEAGDAELFLDLKFHDIPNTVAAAIRSVAPLGPRIVNVHCTGGRAMLQAAREAADEAAAAAGQTRPLLVGVTVLTSLDASDLSAAGVSGPLPDQVLRLAAMASHAGLDGIVCSAHEITRLRNEFGPGFKLITPGIRPAGSGDDDQKRVMTPAKALAAGADYLVIGRPITADPDPRGAAERIVADAAAGT